MSDDKRFRKPTKGQAGRPVKLSQSVQDKIIIAIRAGCYLETAAAMAGIHRSTLHDWLKKGAKQRKGEYRSFSDAVEQAQAEAEFRDVAVIDQSANGRRAEYLMEDGRIVRNEKGNPVMVRPASKAEWQASAWRLERKFPKRWGRVERHEHTGADGAPIAIQDERDRVNKTLKDPEAMAALKLLRDKMARKPDDRDGTS